MSDRLSSQQIERFLKDHPQWVMKDNALYQQFTFKNFVDAFGFMARAAIIAEKHNHHPDWANSYNRVDVCLTTHEVSGLTEKDLLLAQAFDQLFLE